MTGWENLLTLVRRWQSDDRLGATERESALRLAMMLGMSSLAGTLGCSVTMTDERGHFVTPVSDGKLAIALDRVQYDSGRGPCLSAARHGELVLVSGLAGDRRWPELGAVASQNRVRSSLSLPMQIDGSLSALNFYGGDAASYSHSRSQDVARLVARCAAVLLGPGEKAPAEDSELLAELARRRSLIARAVETVKQREGVDATAAYRWLALRSGQLGLPLAQVIAQVLAQQSPVVTLEESS